jgi:tripartite-type tricarboxylate transporter receptor subunit TctC
MQRLPAVEGTGCEENRLFLLLPADIGFPYFRFRKYSFIWGGSIMKKAWVLTGLLVIGMLCAGPLFAEGAQEATASDEWKPSRTITLIVPWGAGGASDLTARTLAGEMEGILGTRIAVVNQPGASGSTGQKSAFDAPKDGYTWAGNADASVATYQVLNYTPEISHRDWQAYFGIFTPCVITVNPSSPIKDWDSLINAFKTRSVNVASAGIGAGGHIAAEAFAGNLGLKYNHVPYGGGNPAVVATVAGETEVVMQLSMEVADMLRAGQLRAIAVLDNKPLKITGVDEIPAATTFAPTMPSVGFHFGLFIPRAIPGNAAKAISDAFTVASQSEAIKKLAEQRGSVPASVQGLEADAVMEKAASMFGWLMYEGGVAELSPEKFGIKRP